MAWDADLIQFMKRQGQDGSLPGIALATMTGPKSCKLKDGTWTGGTAICRTSGQSAGG